MNSKLLTTLTYLQSILDIGDDEVIISLKGNNVRVTRLSDMHFEDVVIDPDVNPIQNILDHITEQMCTDCLKIDYLFQNDFFINLVKGYIESLIHEFGTRVPITLVLAEAIVKYNIAPQYKVYAYVDDQRHDMRYNIGKPWRSKPTVKPYLEV